MRALRFVAGVREAVGARSQVVSAVTSIAPSSLPIAQSTPSASCRDGCWAPPIGQPPASCTLGLGAAQQQEQEQQQLLQSSHNNSLSSHAQLQALSSQQGLHHNTERCLHHYTTGLITGASNTTRALQLSRQPVSPWHILPSSWKCRHQTGQPAVHSRKYAVIKDRRPATLDDVVRRHRNTTSLITGFMVIELYPNGALLDLPTPLSASDLGIPFRDAMLFSSENSVTDQKPTVLVRQSSILFKSEAVRAVINENKAYIIRVKANRSYTSLLDPLVETVKQDDAIPFELNVLEGLLYISCRWFDSRIKHLKAIMDGLMRDVHDSTEPFAAVYNEALIQQLAPLDKAITSLRNGSRGTCEAVRHLLENETMLTEICLTQKKRDAKHAAEIQEQLGDSGCAYEGRHIPPVRVTSVHYNSDSYLSDKEQARRMLESYDRELDAISGKLEEMRENLDTVRDSWSMKLDSARNHIILLNLKMTLASLCLMAATMLPSWGGMNIAHGLPDEPWVFWTVSGISVAVGVVSYPIASSVYKRTWRRRSRRDLLRFHSLRAFLVEHLDDLDDVMDAMKRIQGKMNRVEFERYMRDAMPSAVWKPASLDFLFSQYDLNKDGFLEGIEITKKQALECGAEQEHMPEYLLRSANVDDLYNQEREEPQSTWGRVRKWLGVHQDQGVMDFVMHGKSRWSLHALEERSGGRIIRH